MRCGKKIVARPLSPRVCLVQVQYGAWHVLGNIIMCIFTVELVLKLVMGA